MIYLAIVIFVSAAIMLTLVMCNRMLPEWACRKLGWHLEPIAQGFDGCSFTGKCPRCGEKVMEDSQGNWF